MTITRLSRMQPFRFAATCLFPLILAVGTQPAISAEPPDKPTARKPRVAAVVTVYRRNAHGDMFVSRLLKGYALTGRGAYPHLELASLYTDQTPANDLGRPMAARYEFPLHKTVTQALTLGTGELAVDGVLLVAEHGDYPRSETGQTIYPKRRLFSEIVEVFEQSGRVVPVFSDKHLADNWTDAKWFYDTARRMKIPLMAGSSLPVLWREPPTDVRRGAKLEEIVGISYGPLDSYGFHGLEMVQSLVERRAGGETGVAKVQCLTGDAVWKAGQEGLYNRELFKEALKHARNEAPPAARPIRQLVPEPVLFVIDYRDGLRASLLTLNGAVRDWSAAWRYADGKGDSTRFAVQYDRPFDHFTHLLKGIEKMMHTGKPTWPVERTLLTSGLLDAALISKAAGGETVDTPYLDVRYQSEWNWKQPPPPAPPHKRDAK